jgi:retinol dehydrogenase-12
LQIDLSDLRSIKPAAERFIAKEDRLDVLTNNAGVMFPPKGSVDAQGFELQLGTNCLGPFLFSKCLLPILKQTAQNSAPNSVRVTWASSIGTTMLSPKGGVSFEGNSVKYPLSTPEKDYGQSKAGNTLLAAEFANRYGIDGIISVSWNPGNLKTDLTRHMNSAVTSVVNAVFTYPAVYGAYTELWAACSPELTMSNNGAYIGPWGRILNTRKDVVASMKRRSEGGTGVAEKFWDWCDLETEKYL